VSEHHYLGYPDGACAGVDRQEGAERIAQFLRDVRPDTVLTFAPDGQTGHPDHMAVHHWTADAVRATAIGTLHVVANTQEWMDEFLPQMLQMDVLMGDPPATWIAPLSIDLLLGEEVLARKLTALAAQASQTELLRAAVGDDFYRRLAGRERFGRYPA
jgi:LmbE family N-acetylglucosaminyl deacetylase